MSSFRNIWWSLANEYDFLRELKPEYWDTFTHTVVGNDPYSHLCSIHTYTAKYYKYWNLNTLMPVYRTRHLWRDLEERLR